MRDIRLTHFPQQIDIITLKGSEIKKYLKRISASIKFMSTTQSNISAIDEYEYIKNSLVDRIAAKIIKEGLVDFIEEYNPLMGEKTMVAHLNLFDFYKFQCDFEPERLV